MSEEEETLIIINRHLSILEQLKGSYLGLDAPTLSAVHGFLTEADGAITDAADAAGVPY